MVRLLIIENNDAIAQSLPSWLATVCTHIDRVRTGEEGLLRLQKNVFDAAMVGSALPDMTGAEFCSKISKTNLFLPVIVMGSQSDVEEKIVSLDCGAHDYIDMPEQIAEVPARLRSLLRRYGKQPAATFASPVVPLHTQFIS